MSCRNIRLMVVMLGAVVGCEQPAPPAGGTGANVSTVAGATASATGTAAPPTEVKDHADSATFRSVPLSQVLGSSFEGMPDDYAEARAWAKDDKNRPAKLSLATVAKLVDDLYAAGAEKVYATGLKPTDEGGTTSNGLIALISAVDDRARSRVLEVRNKHYAEYLPTVDKDELVKPLTDSRTGRAAVVIELQH